MGGFCGWATGWRVYSAPCDRSTGVICDQRVWLNGFYAARDYPEQLRRIRFKDPDSGHTLAFLTNNTALPALTICLLYKQRWQVELFIGVTRTGIGCIICTGCGIFVFHEDAYPKSYRCPAQALCAQSSTA